MKYLNFEGLQYFYSKLSSSDKVQNVIEELEKVNTSIDSINIEKSQDSDLVYTLRVDGEDRGTINIPKDQFLKDVSYNNVTNELVFTFVTKDTDNKEVRVNLTDLVDIYTAGNGINIDNKQISVKIDDTSDPYITISENGIKVSGIDEALEGYLPLSGGTMTGSITFESAPDTNGHEYVDLGLPSGNLWAKCNIGANSEEEAGLYFQWGDTQGYTAEQVGDGEGLKAFDWADYKFSINGSSSKFSKYNASDSKTVLDPEDDAANANMGGNWRMPTFEEYKELCLNTDIYLVPTEGEEIQGTAQEDSGTVIITWASQAEGTLKGVKFYKKGDKQTYMFIPAAGSAYDGSLGVSRLYGYLWCSSRDSSVVPSARHFYLNGTRNGVGLMSRYFGFPVRGILSSNTENSKDTIINSKGITIEGKTESDLLNAAGSTTTVQSILDQVPKPDLSPLQNAIGANTYEGSNYLTKETNLTDAVIQLDEEIKATNDNLALEHANAEAAYAKKTELAGYLPLSGGDTTGSITATNTDGFQQLLDETRWNSGINNVVRALNILSPDKSKLCGTIFYYNKTQNEDNDRIGQNSICLSANTRWLGGHNIYDDAKGDYLFKITAQNGVYYDTYKLATEDQVQSKVDNSKWDSLPDHILFAIASEGVNYTDSSVSWNHSYVAKKEDGSYDTAGRSTTKTINGATSTTAGVMSAADKTKLDSINLAGIQVVTALPDAPNENTMYIVIPA